jgi:hypothetical protein
VNQGVKKNSIHSCYMSCGFLTALDLTTQPHHDSCPYQ